LSVAENDRQRLLSSAFDPSPKERGSSSRHGGGEKLIDLPLTNEHNDRLAALRECFEALTNIFVKMNQK